MTHAELRMLLEKYPKYPGTIHIPHSSIVHEGFPGNFNISFGEGPILNRFGNYLDNPEDSYFSTIQPCIRINDFNGVAAGDPTHLLLFDMADIAGFVEIIRASADKREDLSVHIIRSTFDFLINTLGLQPNRFLISYFAGASVQEATNGKFAFDRYIERDPFINIISEFGIKQNQLIPDRSRTTLLSLNMKPPICWGYRNEILYQIDDLAEPLDIGSIENLLWRPIYREGKIERIEDWDNFATFSVVGIERLLMLVNNFNKIYEADSIRPLMNHIRSLSSKASEQDQRICAELIRVFHRIITDINTFTNLSQSRREKLIPLRRCFLTKCEDLGIEYSNGLPDLLSLNAELQNYYPEYGTNITHQSAEISNWLDLAKRPRITFR